MIPWVIVDAETGARAARAWARASMEPTAPPSCPTGLGPRTRCRGSRCAGVPRLRILLGGLGLDTAAGDARPAAGGWGGRRPSSPSVVKRNRTQLADLAGRSLDDSRVRLFEGDVRDHSPDGAAYDVILSTWTTAPARSCTTQCRPLHSRWCPGRVRGLARRGCWWSVTTRGEPYLRRLREAGLWLPAPRAARTGARKKHVLLAG